MLSSVLAHITPGDSPLLAIAFTLGCAFMLAVLIVIARKFFTD